MTVVETARFLEQYAKQYHAGAFATPLRPELEQAAQEDRLHRFVRGNDIVVAVERRRRSATRRKDFTGTAYAIPAPSRVITHIAASAGARLPSMRCFDAIYAYTEDRELVSKLKAQEFESYATRISASSEIIGCYRHKQGRHYPDYERATLTEVPLTVKPVLREAVLQEVGNIVGWRDDFPYYHKGEWSQAVLRGYLPDDPFWGVKPAEMSKSWLAQYPQYAGLKQCDWTVLCKQLPSVKALIESVKWWSGFERIRLLKMGQGQLVRHTDITDRDAGIENGKISRFHLPLVTHPEVQTHAWDLDGNQINAHWEAWHLYYLDQRKPHAVTNPTSTERIHLVVDVISDSKVRRVVGEAAGDGPND